MGFEISEFANWASHIWAQILTEFSPLRSLYLYLSMLNQQKPPRRRTRNNNNDDNNGNDNNGMQQMLAQMMQVMT